MTSILVEVKMPNHSTREGSLITSLGVFPTTLQSFGSVKLTFTEHGGLNIGRKYHKGASCVPYKNRTDSLLLIPERLLNYYDNI